MHSSGAWRAMAISVCGLLLTTATHAADTSALLEFDVFLNDKKIGWHRFEIQEFGDDSLQVASEAKFDVKILFVTAFRYRHQSAEEWQGGCLQEIAADTDANGKLTEISGEVGDSGLVLQASTTRQLLDGCVMTFAYWNPEFLQQERLLNPQTGEYLDVEIRAMGETTLELSGESLETTEYRIVAEGVEVNVWYDERQRWVALESPARGGRVLRYERT